MARDAETKLKKLREKVAKLQEPWAEADMMLEAATDNTLKAIDNLIQQYRDTAEYMSEPMED